MDDKAMSDPLRVAVISPRPLVRAGIVELLRTCVDQRSFVDRAAEEHAGVAPVVVYDLSGVAADDGAVRQLISGGVAVVGLACMHRQDLVTWARAVGITEIVADDASAEQLFSALDAVSRHSPRGAERDRDLRVTPRELDMVRLIGAGLSNEQIADELFLSVNTVKTYIRTAYRKLGVSRRPEAVLWAVHNGLVETGAESSWIMRPPRS